jgi:hypothetical protein
MSADIPRSVMEEARKLLDDVIVTDGIGNLEEMVARHLLARDKRAAGIARDNDAFPEEGEYIASLILTYPEEKESTNEQADT